MAGRRERNKQQKLARAHAAARALFSERGFEATTIRDIAERADIGLGTLYSYARSKHDLLEQLFAAEVEALEERAFASAPPRGRLARRWAHVFGRFLARYATDRPLYRLLVRETLFPGAPPSAAQAARGGRTMARLAELVAEAQRRGEVAPGVDPQAAAQAAFGVYLFHLVAFFHRGVGPARATAALEQALQQLVDGLAPR